MTMKTVYDTRIGRHQAAVTSAVESIRIPMVGMTPDERERLGWPASPRPTCREALGVDIVDGGVLITLPGDEAPLMAHKLRGWGAVLNENGTIFVPEDF